MIRNDKVYVVTKYEDSEGYKRAETLGVFSEEEDAIAYCDKHDPQEESYYVDDYVLDELILEANSEVPNEKI